MEFKVRKESQTLIEKIFHNHERRGVIRSYQMPMCLRSICPDLTYDEEELRQLISQNDKDGTGALDYDTFTKISLHFLLKQTRRESNDFGHKQLVRLDDFPDA